MAQVFVAEVIGDALAYGGSALTTVGNTITKIASGNPNAKIAIGTIEWRTGGDGLLGSVSGFAAPLLPGFQQIPFEGEYVLIVSAPNPGNILGIIAESYYYIGPININADRNANQAAGVFARSTQSVPLIPKPIPPNFANKDVPPLQPLVGDTIIQDRNGSSIRMSSTPWPSFKILSPENLAEFAWKTGRPRTRFGAIWSPLAAGNPIMVISVGAPGLKSKGIAGKIGKFGKTATMVEQPGADASIMYFTSDQRLDFTVSLPFNRKQGMQPVSKELELTNDLGSRNVNPNTKEPEDPITKSGKILEKSKLFENPCHDKDFPMPNQYPLPGAGAVTVANTAANSQIFMRSHRVLIDARLDNVIITGMKDVKFGTKNWKPELDPTMTIIEELMNQVIILSMHCQELTDIVYHHMEVTRNMQFPTGVGPTGPTLAIYDTAIKELQKEVGNSKTYDKTTFGRFLERGVQFQKLYREFGKQKLSQEEKQKNESELKAKGK